MATMRLQDFIIGMIIFSIVVIGFTLFVGELEANYPVTIDPDFEDTFNKINETLAITQEVKDTVVGDEISSGTTASDAFGGALTAIRSLTTGALTPLSIIDDVLNAFAKDLGIDPRIINGIMIALGILLVFLIIAFIRGSIAITA